MRARILLLAILLLLPAFTLLAGDEEFNGRWDIKTIQDRPQAWWIEIKDAGTPKAAGTFISAYGGALNTIDEFQPIKDGQLTFVIVPPPPRQRAGASPADVTPRPPRRNVYTCKLVNGKLEGTYQVEGSTREPIKWVGVRAPVIDDKDDNTWVETKPIAVFNGKDLAGWHSDGKSAELGWVVKDGLLSATGAASNLVSDQKFWNFVLHIEYRLQKGSNSGIGLRSRYEVQVLDDYGRTVDGHSSGALYSRIPPRENASKPPGEWQTFDIRLVGRYVTIAQNGKTVVDKGYIDGLTAIAIDSDEGEPGPLLLQGDHGSVEFRQIVLTPLVRKK
jgi:hypothetical protein